MPYFNVFDKHEFRSLDFNQANFEKRNNQLRDIDWADMRGGSLTISRQNDIATMSLYRSVAISFVYRTISRQIL